MSMQAQAWCEPWAPPSRSTLQPEIIEVTVTEGTIELSAVATGTAPQSA